MHKTIFKALKHLAFGGAAALFALCAAAPIAQAIDRDDDLKPDEDEKIGYSAGTSKQPEEIEAKFPEQAKAVRAFLEAHVAHAMAPEQEREYAARAMALDGLALQLLAVEFAQLSASAATVHTRQLSSYNDPDRPGRRIVDDAIISYRLVFNNDKQWKIAFTERRRLEAQ